MPRCLPKLTSFFDRFLIDFCSRLGPPEPPKSMKIHWFYKHFLICGFFKLSSIFDTILVPTCLHFPSQNPPKSHQKSILKGIDFLIDFCIDFLWIFGRFGLHLGTQVGAMLATFSPQDGPQNASERSRHPTCARTSILEPPGLDFGAPRPRFWSPRALIFDGFLIDFRWIFHNILVIFCPSIFTFSVQLSSSHAKMYIYIYICENMRATLSDFVGVKHFFAYLKLDFISLSTYFRFTLNYQDASAVAETRLRRALDIYIYIYI